MPNCHLAIVSEPMARNVLRRVVVRAFIGQTSSMPQLGGLESKVMEVLWNASSPLSVREVHDALSTSADLAYTTVMTVPVSYTHLRAHETVLDLVCRLLLEKK